MGEVPHEKVEILFASPDTLASWDYRANKTTLALPSSPEHHVLKFLPSYATGRLLPNREFLRLMMNRMTVSFHKYGSYFDIFGVEGRATGIDNAQLRIQKYVEDGNVEWLIDAANYLMMEAAMPSHVTSHFRATNAEESPGRVDSDGKIRHSRNEELLRG